MLKDGSELPMSLHRTDLSLAMGWRQRRQCHMDVNTGFKKVIFRCGVSVMLGRLGMLTSPKEWYDLSVRLKRTRGAVSAVPIRD